MYLNVAAAHDYGARAAIVRVRFTVIFARFIAPKADLLYKTCDGRFLTVEYGVMSINSVATRVSLALAISGALAAAPVAAGGYHGGYGCYNCGYHNNGNVFGAVVGTAVALGFVAAIVSASHPQSNAIVTPAPAYAPVYPQAPVYQGQPLQQPVPVQQQAAPVDPSQTAAAAQVELCSRAAERTAQGYGSYARTVSIESINGEQANATIRGTLEVNPNNGQPLNHASFTCNVTYGQVTGVQLG